MSMNMRTILPKLFLFLLLISCERVTDNIGPEVLDLEDYESSYALIQGEIWDVSCTNCHASGTSFANQSDLILTSDVSYEQLINRKPANQAAREDGLVLVGDKGIESLNKSFLWEKINAPDQEHFYRDHPRYGSLMPLGGEFLTNGELAFILQWIVNGAPKEGKVVDLEYLEDTSRFESIPFAALELPGQGYQFHIEPFEIQPNSDREIFSYRELNNEDAVFINKIEIAMAPGSHHFILYNFPETLTEDLIPSPGTIRDVYNSNGGYNFGTLFTMQYHQFVQGTQWPHMSYQFPEGVALKVPANTGFDLNSHYANRSDQLIVGEVYTNIHTISEEEVENVAEILWLDNREISLPPNQSTTLSRTFIFEEDRNVFQLFSHAHELMTEFRVYISGGPNNGELIYYTDDWEHPPILQLDPPLNMPRGTGFTLEATYENDNDRMVGFGLLSTDEMMMLFGAYY